ncbi:MAG: metallophosphatase family protein [Clostridia bacterium]|nr:metallophosphatase family protein [Clostridia bacterium]
MVKIAVISDTHIPKKSKSLPQVLLDGIKGVDMIIHAGDINRDYVLYELEEIAPVHAVAGNTDDEYIEKMLGKKKIVTVGECRIGIVHGDGTSGTTLERAVRAFKGENVSCVVFGHSHIPVNNVMDDMLCFNPGSATDKRKQEYFSYGILTIDGGNIQGEIKYFK